MVYCIKEGKEKETEMILFNVRVDCCKIGKYLCIVCGIGYSICI